MSNKRANDEGYCPVVGKWVRTISLFFNINYKIVNYIIPFCLILFWPHNAMFHRTLIDRRSQFSVHSIRKFNRSIDRKSLIFFLDINLKHEFLITCICTSTVHVHVIALIVRLGLLK